MNERQMNGFNDLQEDSEEAIDQMYLTFDLGNEVYGIGIDLVREIVGVQNITEVPDMPIFVKGVVNLRGQVIPVIDVRLRFSMKAREYDERTCIIVVEVNSVQIGLVVDTVNEVMVINDKQVSSPPKISSAPSARYLKGMGKVGEDVKILLDGEKLLLDEEIDTLV